MSELTDFLLARIAGDEEWLRLASHTRLIGRWSVSRMQAECQAKRELISLDSRGYDMEPARLSSYGVAG